MEHPTYFRDFLRDHVNLDSTRLDLLGTRVDAVYKALCADDTIGSAITGMSRQGSWAQQTIIRPVEGDDFDADFMLHLDEQEGWAPRKYLDEIYNALNRHKTYSKQEFGRKCRCVYLKYASKNGVGCHLDIVPLVTLKDGRRVIVNKDEDSWEPAFGSTDPQGFTDWVTERNSMAGAEFLRVVRLMKYLKRERGSFNGVKSVLLTTMLGDRIGRLDSILTEDAYRNLPTALLTLVERLDDWLQANPLMPSIPNPSSDGTDFDHRWTQPTYSNFRDRINSIAADMRDAYDEEDPEESRSRWQALFGDKFDPPVPNSRSASMNPFYVGSSSIGSSSVKRSGRAG